MPTKEAIDYSAVAKKALAGEALSREEALSILESPDEDLPKLLAATRKVREHFFGRKVKLCVLMNIQSGLCPEDCGYCSQSAISKANIDKYPLLEKEKIVAAAKAAYENRAKRFCMVASERGPTDKAIEVLAAASQEISRRYPLELCCSLGITDETQLEKLKAAGVTWINHNLNTSAAHYPKVCSTHTYEDRMNTIQNVKKTGMTTCSGGIVGMGEKPEDIVALAFTTRDMDIASIPVNFLHPIPGTPMENQKEVSPEMALKTLCLFRLLNPTKEIRVAGGRERTLGDKQGLALYAANSLFVEGYLTTPGQSAAETKQMIEALGFEVEM